MGWVDRIPKTNIYIGGLHALYQQQELFRQAKITHIVSVLDFDLYEAGHFKNYSHIQVKIDDDPNEDILHHFSTTNKFIDAALNSGGAVFIHCAMGKSRSATIVCAYLMWRYDVLPSKALDWLREGRPVCDPNPGFKEQLDVYRHMLDVKDETQRDRIYKDWLRDRYTGDWYTDRRRQAPKL